MGYQWDLMGYEWNIIGFFSWDLPSDNLLHSELENRQ